MLTPDGTFITEFINYIIYLAMIETLVFCIWTGWEMSQSDITISIDRKENKR